MKQSIIHITLLVKNYDEAIGFYVNKLKFTVKEDTVLSDAKRCVLIQPPGSAGCCLLLAQAANEQLSYAIGNQSGGRFFFSWRQKIFTAIITV
ncbi:VOC family protein [Mucilaginibacter sp. BT774]|uniref:VOC family protein n=1 Tax=Mucilaginibacter sp. BT774 TaxID=3062276 RepID=UPI00349FFAA1